MSCALFALLDQAVGLTMGLVAVALVLTFIRLVRGPTLPDRVIALDMLGVLAVGLIAVYNIAHDQPALLDVATIVALVAFLGTVAFARYVEARANDQ